MEQSDKPNPGSKAAIDAGCTCPVFDNGHGHGYLGMKDVFVYFSDCKLHMPDNNLNKQDNDN
jgi:hypothetical protein